MIALRFALSLLRRRRAAGLVRPCPVCSEDRREPCAFDKCPWIPEVRHG